MLESDWARLPAASRIMVTTAVGVIGVASFMLTAVSKAIFCTACCRASIEACLQIKIRTTSPSVSAEPKRRKMRPCGRRSRMKRMNQPAPLLSSPPLLLDHVVTHLGTWS